MGEDTGISWTDDTWNPWMGCTKVSPGCAHCYMFRDQARYGNDPTEVRRSKTKFDAPLKIDGARLIFTCSWSDWFHEAADPWRDEAWDVIRRCPQHTFQILTKRPELVTDRLPDDWGDGYPNVWLGVSIENARHTFRADLLRGIPAALRFISAEPLLGNLYPPVDALPDRPDPLLVSDPADAEQMRRRLDEGPGRNRAPLNLDGIGWVIIGGESGSKADARPLHPTWAREIRDHVQTFAAEGIGRVAILPPRPALHFKQWGSWTPDEYGNDSTSVWLMPDGTRHTGFHADAYGIDLHGAHRVRYAGPLPSAGGKHLDGVDWCEIPDRATPEPPGQLTLA